MNTHAVAFQERVAELLPKIEKAINSVSTIERELKEDATQHALMKLLERSKDPEWLPTLVEATDSYLIQFCVQRARPYCRDRRNEVSRNDTFSTFGNESEDGTNKGSNRITVEGHTPQKDSPDELIESRLSLHEWLNDISDEVGRDIAIRSAQGFSQTDIAKMLNMKQYKVSRILKRIQREFALWQYRNEGSAS